MSKVPVKSRSRGIQKAHIRRYGAGKVSVVNERNVKKNVSKRRVKVIPKKDLVNAFNSSVYFNKRGVVDKRKFNVPSADLVLTSPEAFWRELKKRDSEGFLKMFNNNLFSFKKVLHTMYVSFGFSSRNDGVGALLDWFKVNAAGAQRHYLFGDNSRVNVVYKGGLRQKVLIHSDFIDPFEGQLFLKDRLDMTLKKHFIPEEVNYPWDKNKWFVLELNKMNKNEEGSNLKGSDKDLYDFLIKSKIPFVHSIDTSNKKGNDIFLIPRSFGLRVFTHTSLPYIKGYFKKVDMLDSDLISSIDAIKRELSLPVDFSDANYKEVFK